MTGLVSRAIWFHAEPRAKALLFECLGLPGPEGFQGGIIPKIVGVGTPNAAVPVSILRNFQLRDV